MGLQAGSKLGPYEIVTPLGHGGMGEVYRARDSKLQREVAIKVLPEHLARDADRLARLRREAQVLAALNNPHIAHIHGLEDESGAPHSSWNLSKAPHSQNASQTGRCHFQKRSRLRDRSPMRSKRRTRKGSSTAT